MTTNSGGHISNTKQGIRTMAEKAHEPQGSDINKTAEQMKHSGVDGHEKPVFNFAGQDLQTALDSGALHIEYDESGKARVIVPNSLGDHVDPTKSQRTDVYEPLVPATETVETEELAPATETVNAEKKSKKGLLVSIGSAAAGVALTAAAFLGLSGGDDKTEPSRAETSASAVPTSEAPTPVEAFDLFENNMLFPEGSAEEVLGNYATIVSKIINARVDAGVPVPTNEDLRYLVDPAAAPEDIAAFESFVQSKAAAVVEARRLYEENGLDSNIDINVYSNFVSSTPNPDGGFVIEARDEYWAITEDGQQNGNITANLDTHIYTFVRADVPLPDGSFKNTLVLSKFENVQNTATE